MEEKNDWVQRLRQKIRELEGFSLPKEGDRLSFGLGILEQAFSENKFPVGVIHEFVSTKNTEASSVNGFIAGLLSILMRKGNFCLWISHRRTLFPAGLKQFGVDPHRVIFVDVEREKDVLWAVEQALKCNQLAAVVGELREISFADSQRLQLAVERSKVTGFLHRFQPRIQQNLACATRWKIMPLPSRLENNMPGVGFSAWEVQLLKARNGKTGMWHIEWKKDGFRHRMSSTFTKKERQYA